ncbi:MAG: TonB-dependent receptor [Acidobacteriia bacterium]|nr:TonB-dependent receptor [Terriglobia bacterium]
MNINWGEAVGLRKAIRLFGLIVCAFAFCVPLFSQVNTGRISGNVHDQSGGVVTGATVTVLDVARGISRPLTTDQAGEYSAPNLTPGSYTIRVEYKGFKTAERAGITLEVGRELRLDFELQPGEQTQTLTVTEDVPLVETTTATLGGTLSNQTINDLPLNGRNYQNLLQYRPGVAIYPGGGAWTQSTNGLRPEHNVYLLDGVSDIEPFSALSMINGAGIAGDASTILPIDAIQEFNLQVNPKAEYGWKPGAIVNVGLKSGTNDLHGTAYAFGRDSAMDAKNPFLSPTTPKQAVTLEQFGATAGGPIKKDKIFFFGAYEGQRYNVGNAFNLQEPTSAAGAGRFNSIPDALADMATHSVAENPLSAQLVSAGIWSNSGSSTNISVAPVTQIRSDNTLAKVDFHLSDHHQFGGYYFFGDNSGLAVGGNIVQPYWRTSIHTRSQVAGAAWNYTPNSNWVNEARFGFNRLYQPSLPGDCQQIGQPNFGLNTGATSCGFPQIQFGGSFTPLGCCANFPKYQGPDTDVEIVDNIFRLHGNHAFKFGGELRKAIYNGGTFRAGKGAFNFGTRGIVPFAGASPLEDFLAGMPSQGRVLVGDPRRHLSDWGFAGFLQDDWRVTPRLTVNLGLRYEYVTPVKEANDLLGNFDPTLGMVQVGKQISSPYNGDPNNFGPRVGFAWDVTGSGRNVIRAGAGIIYVLEGFNLLVSQQGTNAVTTGLNTVPTGANISVTTGGVTTVIPSPGNIAVGSVTLNPPGNPLNWSIAGPIFPNTSAISCTNAAPCPLMGADQNLKSAYVSNWNLSIQHAFTHTLSLDMAFVGNKGTKLLGLIDLNQPAIGGGWTPAAIAAFKVSTTAEQAARPFVGKFPYLSNINYLGNYYNSNYNGLQLTLTQQTSRGLSFMAGYTYSHGIDDVSNDWNTNVPTDSNNPGLERGSSFFDIRHRFTFTSTYAIPGRQSPAQLLEGWVVNAMVNIQSALPWSVIDSANDLSGTGELVDRWNFYGNPSDFSNRGASPIPFFQPGTPPPTDPLGPTDPAYAINNAACAGKAAAIGATASLTHFGCYAVGSSFLIAPAPGTLGTMGRNLLRGNGLHLLDMSLAKNWKFRERFGAQFRFEVFNLLNQTQYANPQFNGAGGNSPSATSSFGASFATPDVSNNNPVIGNGGSRAIQLGLKLSF